MRKTLIGLLAVAGMLHFATSVQAVPQLKSTKGQVTVQDTGGPGQSPNAGSIDDSCLTSGDGFPLGMLTPYMLIPADTTGLADDFQCDPACGPHPCDFAGICSSYLGDGFDGVAKFQVPVGGNWTFSQCATGAVFDSSLAVRTGFACPGATCVGQDSDSCAACAGPYRAKLTVALLAGQDYWLIVDGYSPGGAVEDLRVTGPCTTPADCQDGVFCNGAELCTAGTCAAGANPCTGTTPLCDENTDTCSGCSSNPAACIDNGLFCDGPGACLPTGACGQFPNPCNTWETCIEATDTCVDPDPCLAWEVRGPSTGGSGSPQSFNACVNQGQADDIELSLHAGRDLIYYQTCSQAQNLSTNPACANGATPPVCQPHALGDPYTSNMSLWSTASGGVCTPDAVIPNSTCAVTMNQAGGPLLVVAGGTIVDDTRCDASVGLGAVTVPDADDDPVTGQCGVDVWMVVTYSGTGRDGAMWRIDTNIAGQPTSGKGQVIGGPAFDDEAAAFFAVLNGVWATPDCNSSDGSWAGTWQFSAFGAPHNNDFRRTSFCTEPIGACCDGLGGCSIETEPFCTGAGGTYLGDQTIEVAAVCDAPDGDGDGVRNECDGCPNDINKVVPGVCGCGIADTDTDGDQTADCIDGCPIDPDKIAAGICGCGVSDADSDGDGTVDCQDGCPADPNKTAPGVCGCGISEGMDSDGDGYLDCVDRCPGVDDDVFFPGCVGAIPTVSEWGLVVLALLLLAGAKVYFGRRTVRA